MINKVQEFITRENLFSKDNNLLLAISGGADSVCLFFILKELGYKFELAHCNFNLRGKESDQEENFIIKLANKYMIDYHIKSFPTQDYSNSNKISIQMAARELRYKWFQQLLEKNHLDFIVTAHHRDDNVETFLINLIRGTGINGFSGIKAKNKNIIRPLIQISYNEIRQYLDRKKIIYCNDSSNLDVKYIRNKIRHQVIPLLKEINPNIQKTIAEEIFLLNGVNKIFQHQIDIIKRRLVIEKDGCYKIDINDLMALENLEIILFEIFSPFGFKDIRQIIRTIKSQSGKQFFSANYQLIIDRKEIIISLLLNNVREIEIIKSEKDIEVPLKMNFDISDDLSLNANPNIGQLDFDKLSFPLRLRKWKKGDRFKPLGMNNFKKLSDFFIDEKYSIIDKEKQWILCSEKDIIWIVGNRIDERYKIDTKTKKVYIAKLLE